MNGNQDHQWCGGLWAELKGFDFIYIIAVACELNFTPVACFFVHAPLVSLGNLCASYFKVF